MSHSQYIISIFEPVSDFIYFLFMFFCGIDSTNKISCHNVISSSLKIDMGSN